MDTYLEPVIGSVIDGRAPSPEAHFCDDTELTEPVSGGSLSEGDLSS